RPARVPRPAGRRGHQVGARQRHCASARAARPFGLNPHIPMSEAGGGKAAEVAAATLPPRSREPLIDALRMLAMVGVFTVNAMSYASGPYGSLLGQPQPAGSFAALAAYLGVAAVFQAKAYPLLALLFGYSFALSMRARAAAAVPHRRLRMA